MKRIISFLLALCLMLGLAGCGQKAAPWQEQYDLGIRYLSEGNYQEAIIAFEAAIKIDPKVAALYVGRAQAYIGSGETAENLAAALNDYKQALELDETSTDAWLGLADAYIRQEEYDKAEEILKEALDKAAEPDRIQEKLDEIADGKYTDSDGNMRRMSYYEGGELIWYHAYAYDKGRQISATSFDGSGNQTSHVDLEYDEAGRQLVGCYYAQINGKFGKSVNEYDAAGNLIRSDWYTPEGELTQYFISTYDDAGNCIREDSYTEDGDPIAYQVYEYNDQGQMTRDSSYDFDGTPWGYTLFEYDSEGKRSKEECYTADGALESYKIYDENGWKEYDPQGNLTNEMNFG